MDFGGNSQKNNWDFGGIIGSCLTQTREWVDICNILHFTRKKHHVYHNLQQDIAHQHTHPVQALKHVCGQCVAPNVLHHMCATRSIGWALFGVNFRPLQEIETIMVGGWIFDTGPFFVRLQYFIN